MLIRVRIELTVLLLPVLLLVSRGSIAAGTDYVGAEVCRTCHEVEYQQWRSSGHAEALARLTAVQQRDRVCRSCHTMAQASDEAALAGVQCESCHGAGGYYALRYVMKDKVLAHLLGEKDVNEESCSGCHTQDGPSVVPFAFKEKVDQVRHRPKPEGKKASSSTPPAPAVEAHASR